jgi:hypothetical protein
LEVAKTADLIQWSDMGQCGRMSKHEIVSGLLNLPKKKNKHNLMNVGLSKIWSTKIAEQSGFSSPSSLYWGYQRTKEILSLLYFQMKPTGHYRN